MAGRCPSGPRRIAPSSLIAITRFEDADLRSTPRTSDVASCSRQFTLNEEIDDGRIKARMRNGVLKVELPKRDKAGAPD
jgi:HSP20 family molecular chaperone IbpA